MSTVRPMRAEDLLRFDMCNLDPLTETYNISFYLGYLAKWPSLCNVIVSETDDIEGYSKTPDRMPPSPLTPRSFRQSRRLSAHESHKLSLQPRHEQEPSLPAVACAHHRSNGRAVTTTYGPREEADGDIGAARRGK